MNASSTTGTNPTTAPLSLWRVAEAFMHLLHALFGDPSDVAAKHTLTLKAHQLMASWLRAGEAMMRRLLLIEAAAFAKPNTRPLLRAPRKRRRKLMSFTAEEPEKWRVRFRCFSVGDTHARRAACQDDRNRTGACVSPTRRQRLPRDLSAEARRAKAEERWCADHWPRPRFRSAWPLAERYEALLRVFNNPLAHARRLARRLHATPHRTCEVLHASPHAEHRIDHFDKLTEAALASAARFNSS